MDRWRKNKAVGNYSSLPTDPILIISSEKYLRNNYFGCISKNENASGSGEECITDSKTEFIQGNQ